MPPRHRARHRPPRRKRSDRQPGATRTVRAVHEVQHPRHAGTRRPDARVAGSDSLGAGCHLRSVTNDRDHAVRGVQMAVEMQEPDADASPEVAAGRLRAPFEIRIGINTGEHRELRLEGANGLHGHRAAGEPRGAPPGVLPAREDPHQPLDVGARAGARLLHATGRDPGPDADRRAAPDAPARGGAAPWRTTIAASPRRRGSPNRQPTARRSRSCTWRRSLCSPRTSPPCCRTPCPPCRAGKSR